MIRSSLNYRMREPAHLPRWDVRVSLIVGQSSKLTKSIGCLSITSVNLEDLPLTHQHTNLVFAIWNLNLPAATLAIRQATLLCTFGMPTTERKSA